MNLPQFDPNSSNNIMVCIYCAFTHPLEVYIQYEWPQAPLICACRFNRIDILEKLLNMENIDLSAEFVILSAFFYIFLFWTLRLSDRKLQCHVRSFCCNFDWFFVDNEQQGAIIYCLQHKKNDLLEVLLVKGAEYYPVCPLFLIVLIMRLIVHRGDWRDILPLWRV